VMSVVLVYTNGRTVQSDSLTDQPVNPTDFHKGRFKDDHLPSSMQESSAVISLEVSVVLCVAYTDQFHSCGGLLEIMQIKC
jgi:hypothetical protein